MAQFTGTCRICGATVVLKKANGLYLIESHYLGEVVCGGSWGTPVLGTNETVAGFGWKFAPKKKEKCPHCNGIGRVVLFTTADPCKKCNGTGTL